MKNILLLIFVFALTNFYFSQTYTLNSATSGTTISTCSGTFVDDGGSAANYSNGQNTTITFCPATPGDVIKVTFTSLALRATGSGACQDILDIYQGNAAYAAPLITAGTPDDRLCGTYTGTNLPVFYSTSSSGCITFNFISDGSQVLAGWTASISCVTPCSNPIAALTSTTVLNICGPSSNNPGALTVNFNASNSILGSYGPGGSTVTINSFQWNFGDGVSTTTSGSSISHTYPNVPGVYVMKLSVKDNNTDLSPTGCSSTNSVTKIIRVLPAPTFTGTTITPQNIGCGSNATLTGVATSQTETQNIPSVAGVTVSLPDGSGGSFVSNADFSGLFPTGATLTPGCYPTLWFNLEHSYTGDLTIDLISPSGQTVRVFNRHGVGGMFGPIYMFGSCVDGADDGVPGCGATYSVANAGGQSWTNYGGAAITTTSSSPCAVYAGPCQGGTAGNPYYTPTLYTSTNSFAVLNGSVLNGIWQIKITDNLAQDDGFLFSWGLVFPSSCYAPLESITPDLTTLVWTNGGAGPAVPVSQTTSSISVSDPGPDACPVVGNCLGNQLTNTINFGPFNTPGTYPYLITATDEFGCTYTNTVNVAVSCACPSLTAMSYAGPYCRSINSQITPTVSGSGAIASGSYSSTPVGLSIDISSGVVTPSLSIANTYTITYLVAATGGCSAISINTVLTISSTPTITASASNSVICLGNSTSLIGGGATTYTWTGGVTNSASFSPTTTASYTVTGTSASGCTNTAVQTITVNPTPTVTASASNSVICIGNSTSLTASGASSYTWSGGVANGAAFSPTATASYTVTGTSAAGCTNTAVQTITVNPIPVTTASATGTINCATPTITLNSSLAGVNYTWTAPSGGSVSSANTQSTSVSGVAGVYTLNVQSAAGCTYSTTASVTQNTTTPTGLSAGSNQTLTCSSTSVTLNGSITTPTNATVLWTGPSVSGSTTSFSTSANGAGVYTLTATNPINGCTATSTVQVSPSAGAPSVTLNPVTNTITCTNTLVTVSISSTVSSVSYIWSGPGIASGNGTGTITVNQGGSYNFTLTNTTNSCTTSNNQVVVQNINPPTATASNTTTLTCSTTAAVLTGGGGGTYVWTGPSITGGGSTSTPTVNAPGNYTVTVTAANGCTAAATASVTQNSTPPTATASNTTTLTCSTTAAVLTGGGGGTYAWTGASIAGGGSTSTPTINAPGNYTVTVTAANGCTAVATASVTQNSTPPTATASNTTTLTCSTTAAVLTGGGGGTYFWTGPSITGGGSTSTPTVNAPGNYTVTVTAVNGCTAVATASVIQNSTPPTATASNTTTLTCSTTAAVLTGGGGGTYVWTGPSIIGGGSTSTPTVNAPGNYTVTVTAANGCTAAATSSVSQNITAPITTASTSGSLTCSPLSTVSLSSTLSGMNYTWTAPSGGLFGSANSQNTSASGAAGIYTLSVVDPTTGCSFTTTTSVSQNAIVPTTTASVSGVLTCSTLTVDLNSTLAGMNYTWTTPVPSTINTQSTTATIAGDYTLSVLDPSNGCSYTTTISVAQNTTTPIGLTAGANQTLTCPSNSLTLNGSITTPTNATILWTGPSITGSTNSYTTTVNGAGVYTLTATDPVNSCSVTASVEVYPNAGSPVASITSTALVIDCNNASQSVTVTSSPSIDVVYNWNTVPSNLSSDGAIATFTNANTYICTVTNTLSNCSTPIQVVVTSNTTIPTTTLSVSGVLTCSTLIVDLNSTLAGMNYTWTTPAPSTINTQSTTVTTAGDYTLSVQDPANGCSYTTTISVVQNTTTPIGLIAGTNQTLTCPSNSLTLNGSITTPTNANVLWTGPSITGNTNSFTTTVNGAGIYTLTATNPLNGCIATSTVEVFSNAGSPVASITSTALVLDCNNASQSVTVTSVPSTDVTYNWNTAPSSLSSNGTIATFTNANTYICTVTNTLSNCSTPVQVVVTSNTIVPTINITPTQTLTCATPTAAITLTTTPSSGLTYAWIGTLLSGQGTDLITVNQPGNYSVGVTNAANGCTNTASSQVDVDANLPTASINISSTNSIITCSNQSVDLTVNVSPLAAYNYTWSTASTATNINVTSANVYSVTVVNPTTGCSAVALYTVTSNTISPTVQTTNTVIPCNTTTVNVIATSTSAVTYSWTSISGNIITNGTSTALVGSTGDYVVTVTDINNGCVSTASASVSQTTINSSFTANPLSGTAPLLVDFTNTSNNPVGTTYSWNFGDSNTANTTNSSNTYTLIGNYTVALTATDAASLCTATSTINIEVLENSYISVPNVFTPNGDNANDVFKIDARGIKDLTCEIFNRWGSKIYTLIATKDSWDGLNQSAGTYFYLLTAKGYDGKEYTQQGFISLFK